MVPWLVTQTGHPGPLTSRTRAGSRARRPDRRMATVCVPQISMRTTGAAPGRAAAAAAISFFSCSI